MSTLSSRAKPPATYDPSLGVELAQALRYVAAWRGRRVVVKLGGRALESGELGTLMADVALLHESGLLPILVHGGGPEISRTLELYGIQPRFLDGLRVTDDEVMQVVEMVLAGSVNKRLVRLLQEVGGNAMGLSGRDGGLLRVAPHPRRELGYVGEVVAVEVAPISALLDKGFVPVIATLGIGPDGASYNVNADTAAAALASAVKAEKLIVLTDVPGIFRTGADGERELLSELDPDEARQLIREGVVGEGMVPKVEGCLAAIAAGVPSAHIVGASEPHALLVELFTEAGSGTMLRTARSTRSMQPTSQEKEEDPG